MTCNLFLWAISLVWHHDMSYTCVIVRYACLIFVVTTSCRYPDLATHQQLKKDSECTCKFWPSFGSCAKLIWKHKVTWGWGIYGSNRWVKWAFVFERYAQKHLSSGEYPFWSSHYHGLRSLWSPVLLQQKGRDHSPSKARLRTPALGWLSQCYDYSNYWTSWWRGQWVELS